MFGQHEDPNKAEEAVSARPAGEFNAVVRLSLAQVDEGTTPQHFIGLGQMQRCLSTTSSPWAGQHFGVGVTSSSCGSPFAYLSPYAYPTRLASCSPVGPAIGLTAGPDFATVYSRTLLGSTGRPESCTPRVGRPISIPEPTTLNFQQSQMPMQSKHEQA